MSERYTRLFSLPENIGQDGCPVLISAGALLKDNNTEKVLVQLKLRNISEQVIKSVKVKINAYDTAGTSLKGIEAFSYLDLTVERDDEFGSQTPIVLPDKTTRSFDVEIVAVIFFNGEQYAPSATAKASIAPDSILEAIRLRDLEKRQLQNAKKMRIFGWIPLVIGIIVLLGEFLWPTYKMASLSFFFLNRHSFSDLLTMFVPRYFSLHQALAFVKHCVVSCLVVPCIPVLYNYFIKNNSKICYMGLIAILCYSVLFLCMRWEYICQYWIGLANGLRWDYIFPYWISLENSSYYILGLLSEVLPLMVNISTAFILLFQAKKQKNC